MGCEETGLVQCHREVQTRLTTEGRQDGVRLLLLDQLLQYIYGQRLNVYMIRDILIGHDGRRVRVQQYDLDALFLQ